MSGRRAGPFLSRRPDRAGHARRGRRHARLFLDAASERGAAHGRACAGPCRPCRHGRDPAHGRRLRRQGSAGDLFAALAALAAAKTGRPCKLRLDRDDDMTMTGKRHDFRIDYEVGFDDDGVHPRRRLRSTRRAAAIRPICPRRSPTAPCSTADNAYFYPAAQCPSRAASTPTPSPTPPSAALAVRKGMVGAERVIDEVAFALGKRSARRAQAQFLRRDGPRHHALPPGRSTDNIIAEHGRRTGANSRLSRAPRGRSAPSTRTARCSSAGSR